MKRLLFVLLLMTCSVSWAEWERVVKTDNYVFFVDRATIRKKSNFVEMWEMTNFFETQVTEVDKQNYKSRMHLSRYDCSDGTRGTVSFLMYAEENGKGNVVLSHMVKKNEIEDNSIPPGSLGELLWKIACGRE